MKPRRPKSTMSYYRTLYGKYSIDDVFLRTRAQRRVTGAFLEQIDQRDLRPDEKIPQRMAKRLKRAYRHSPFLKMLTTTVTAAALIAMLQAPPAQASSKVNRATKADISEQMKPGYQNIGTDDDSFPETAQALAISSQNLSLHFIAERAPQSQTKPSENELLMDEDSDVSLHQAQQLVLTVIDTSIEDWQHIYEATQNSEVLLLDGSKPPLESIVDTLAEMKDVDAINIISHGNSGMLLINGHAISSDSLERDREKWQEIGRHMSQHGDIKLYGCNVAKGEQGKLFIEKLAAVTGADIAASINITGSASRQGDWKLESVVGEVSTADILSMAQLQRYSGVLAFTGTIDFSTITVVGAFGGSNTINAAFGGAGGYTLTIDGADHSTYGYAATGRGYSSENESQITLSFNGGETFDTSSIFIYNIAGGTGDTFIISSDKGDSVSTGSVGDLVGTTVDLSGFSTGLTKLYISVQDGYGWFGVDDFAVANVGATASDSDGTLTSAGGISEPVNLPSTTLVGSPVSVFDFTITDGGGGDGKTLDVSQIDVNLGGTASANFSKMRFNLSGCASKSAITPSGSTVSFTSTGISVADGGSTTCTISAYWGDNTGITDNQTVTMSIDGDTDLTVDTGKTTMSGSNSAVSTGSMSTTVAATALSFTTQPAGSVSGSALTTQPVVNAVDAANNIDTDFIETITLTEASSGVLTNNSTSASSGVATFSGLTYTATADQQSFTLTANDQDSDLPTVNANAVTSDVVATKLIFSTEPSPTSVNSGQSTAFTTVPIVSSVDGDNIVDTGYSTDITLSEINGAGAAIMNGTGDTDGNGATVTITPSSGVSAFTGLNITYTVSGVSSETFNLRASSGGLTTADSTQLTGLVDSTPPTITDGNISISGSSGSGGAFKVGDTVTATWNNTAATGDNNSDVSTVTVDFSQFGGGSAVSASNSTDTWSATFTLTEDGGGSIDSTNRNVSVTAVDNATNSTTTADTTHATVDNDSPVVSNGNLSISGASGAGGAFRVGDTITATWNNTAGGDNNSDTISSVSVDFTQFGGGSGVSASNSAGTWSATYTVTEDGGGSVDNINRNISLTAIDNAGNSTTTAGTSNATIDNDSPILTDGNINISGASGTGGAFKVGDTITATWNNTAGGDNNSDTIGSVSVDFSQFGGGSGVSASNSSGTWSATYTLTEDGGGSIDNINRNVSVTALDNAANSTTVADTTNATVDNDSPVVTDGNIGISGGSGTGGAFKVGDTVTATWNNTAGGDNNSDTISTVTVDFSQFGGGSSVSASNSSGTWSATYAITEDGGGSIDNTNLNVSITVVDNADNSTTTTDTTGFDIDNDSPVVTDGNININNGSGTGGAFKVGDIVIANWNNTAGGDNNSDTISTVTVDFSQFGGGTGVSASNSSDTWTATYTITEDGGGSIDNTNRNVSVTAADNAANSTTTSDTTNAIVDNDSPVVTDSNLSISGASGIGSAFKVGDTITATWDNTAGGDNNSDTISSVSVDFSQFGGGAAVSASNSGEIWEAAYTITENAGGGIETVNRNLTTRATDNAGNSTTTADSSNATVDSASPAAPSTPDMAAITDNGVSTTDNKTSDTTPLFVGSAEAGSIVTLMSSVDSQIGSATTDGSGNWSVSASTLSYGSHDITAQTRDSVGNGSPASGILSILINHDPTFLGTPTITGTPDVNETLGLADLATSDADAGDAVILSYQWKRGNDSISGATLSTYLINETDKRKTITCEVTAHDLNGGMAFFTTGGIDIVDIEGNFPWLLFAPALSFPNRF